MRAPVKAWRIDADRIGIVHRDTREGFIVFEHEAFDLYESLADIFNPNPSEDEQRADVQASKRPRLGMQA